MGGKREEQSEDRKAQILRAALDAFLDRGLIEATIADIRQASGASIGSLYHHFGGKQGIAIALYLSGAEPLHTAMLKALLAEDEPRSGIEAVVRVYLDWFAEHPRHGLFLFRAVDLGFLETPDERIARQERSFMSAVHEWLRPHVISGRLRDLPKDIYVPLVIGPSRDFLRAWLTRGAPRPLFERALQEFPPFAWQAVRGRQESPDTSPATEPSGA